MAEWKKIIVSGSDAHLASVTASNLTNNNILVAGTGGALESSGITYDGTTLGLGAGVITSTGATSLVSGSFSGSFEGDGTGLTGVVADSFDFDSLTAGTTIDQGDHLAFSDAGTEKKITFSNLEDAVFGNVSGDATIAAGGALTIAADSVEGTMLNTNVADTTTIELSSDTLSVLKVPNALTDTTGGGLNDFSFDGSSAVSLEVSGAAQLSDNAITKWHDTDNKFVDSSLTDNGTAITGTTSIQLTGASSNLSGSFSGSFQGDGGSLTGIATTLTIDADSGGTSTVNLQSQTLDVEGTANEIVTSVSGQTITVGLPDNVVIAGNLTVQGTQTSLNTENLLVEDRFALFNSGSATGDGGIIVQTESDFSGAALGWDDSEGRFGLQITSKLAQNASALAPDSYIASVVTSDTATYQKNGNIRVQGGDIFIYVE